jgi:hypothetical protein
MTRTTLVTGASYILATQNPPRATFVVDTGGYQSGVPDGDDDEECAANILGTATKLRVSGRVNVNMNFMQFFGFRTVPVQDEATAENLTSLDVMVVFDISGSMEDQTISHDFWVRTNYNAPYPNNGYFNPLPYNPAWAIPGTDNQAIPNSTLCISPTDTFDVGALQYLTVEAELYSRNAGNWDLGVRTPGQGFWAIQRGSKVGGNNALGEDNEQRNAAGTPTQQSSNVCRPNVTGAAASGIDCTVGGAGAGGDDVCLDSAGADIAADCSAYISARPFLSYGQVPGNIPNLNGAAYNADCFPAPLGLGACWRSSPFWNILGDGPTNVPWVEYDFTPTWNGQTYIWIRAIGGGEESYTWAGSSPDQLQPDLNGGGVGNNVVPWRKVIYWQVGNGAVNQRKDNMNADYQDQNDDNTRHFQMATSWRDNRAENARWRWIKLGQVATTAGNQYTLKLYQGSAGYKVDKIVFTNDNSGTTPEAGAAGPAIPAVLRRRADGTTAPTDGGDALGPPASPGSATREACNRCNPAYGYTVNPNECSCRLSNTDNANGGYGAGTGCSIVLTTTNQLQAQLQTGLYSNQQPIRSAIEAVKNFARKLDPKFDQLGIVPFTNGSDNTTAQADPLRRTKLQCLSWATTQLGNPARCYDPTLGPPLTYTNVISAVERNWAEGGTNIAIGMREGLEELGISSPGNAATSNCTAAVNDGNACDRRGAARRVIILMTDGSPNGNPGNCAPGGGRPDVWDGNLGTSDDDFECAVYYGFLAAQNNVTVYTIGIGAGANQDVLTAMATGWDPRGDDPDVQMFTGGQGQFFPAAKPTDLDLIFDQILSNIYVRIIG